ncbi:MAG: lytic murein transglycosylase [Patescibacteria group bacterium]
MQNKNLKPKNIFAFCFFILLFAFCFFNLSDAVANEVDPNAIVKKRVELEKELKKIETEIDQYKNLIEDKQRESTSLERDISIIDAKIQKARLEIKARNLAIEGLEDDIREKSKTINSLTKKEEEEKKSLAELIRRVNELDTISPIELVLGYNNFSDFFVDIDSFDLIQGKMKDSFQEIKSTRDMTEKEKEDLELKESEEEGLRTLQELEKKRSEQIENEKKKILKVTKGKEKEYQKILSARQKDAATIRSQLFILTGSPSIPFEKAVEYANFAYRATGVRPAFLLGVIAEESNLGANVGKGNWKIDLANSRCSKQREAFIEITNELGLNPDMMPVSKKVWYGYCGGAMGPAQFMPTTWQSYKSKISSLTGHNPPSPWDPKDAFIAAALLLKDNGAAEGGYTAERRAALKYLAGSNWNKKSYSFYGDDVMELAAKYQEQINIIQNSQ